MRDRLWKVLRVAIPFGTLLLVFVGWLAARVGERPMDVPEIIPRPPPTLPPLVFAARDQRVDGRVVDAQERGVPDALVWLRSGDEPHWTYTDPDGAFQLDGVGPGPWPVVVVAHGYEPHQSSLDVASVPCTISIGAALPQVPLRAPIVRTPLVGRVSSTLSVELEGYEVWLAPLVAPETLGAPLPRRTRCDREGRFEIADLAHGEYAVRVIPAWARGGSWPDLTQPLQGGSPVTWTHGAPNSPSELSVPLAAGEIRGVLETSSGDPLEGALVLISRADDPGRVWPPISTAADGSLVARDLPPGSYNVSIRAGSAVVRKVATLGARQSLLLEVEPLDVGGGR